MSGALLVASPGGHIDELFEFASRIADIGEDRSWITAATPQTQGLLADQEVHWVPPVASRQFGRALMSSARAVDLVRRLRPDIVISTGAALAVPYLTVARAHRVETHYIESATRLEGPSLSGRLIGRLPGVGLHHQGFRTPVRGWEPVGSVFDAYAPGPLTEREVRRAVLILGTERYPFPRALDLVVQSCRPGIEVLLQTGHTPTFSMSNRCRQWVPGDELMTAVRQADVVITHAGVGSVLSALRAGKHPVVIPRLAALGEHVDDHQLELASLLQERGLASVAAPGDDLSMLLERAVRRTAVSSRLVPISL